MSGQSFGASLKWLNRDQPNIFLTKVITTLGRNEANDILLDDPKVSSFHANILQRRGKYHLLDLKSRNGILVNDQPILDYDLGHNDILSFGELRLQFLQSAVAKNELQPMSRLQEKIHTMAIERPDLRKNAAEVFQVIEKQQEFLKDLVDLTKTLAESESLAELAHHFKEILESKFSCHSLSIAFENKQSAPDHLDVNPSEWDSRLKEELQGKFLNGRYLNIVSDEKSWTMTLAFAGKDSGNSIAFIAKGGADTNGKGFAENGGIIQGRQIDDHLRDMADMLLLFISVLWSNLENIEAEFRKATGLLLEAKENENRQKVEGLEKKNRELDDFVKQMRTKLVFAEGGPMEKVQALARKLATVDMPVLINGQTGTGKTYIAKLVHLFSSRSAKPFIVVDCATLPANLIESELFGHEKGAFTGALTRKLGKVEACSGGTLFLDEIGDLPLELQGKLLRLVQEGIFERLGGTETLRVDARIISATHYDLEKRVKDGLFREDLFYRLHVLPLQMPPLRERIEDIPILAKHFIQKHFGYSAWNFSDGAIQAIADHTWPGNVRELENKLQRAWLFHEDKIITEKDLGLEIKRPVSTLGNKETRNQFGAANLPSESSELPDASIKNEILPAELFESQSLEHFREVYESALLKNYLKNFHGNITKCAEQLKISRNTCKSMLRKYRLLDSDEDEA